MGIMQWLMSVCIWALVFWSIKATAYELYELDLNQQEDGDNEETDEFVLSFQQVLDCSMGMTSLEELMAKFNCSQCERCYKDWNAGYLELNFNPICDEYKGQLYVQEYEFECLSGHARCIKKDDRCEYETCELDSAFVSCLKMVKLAKHFANDK